MSLYNLVNGVNQATFYILPMLGKHPDEYPRFRDCFIGKMTNHKQKTDLVGIPIKQHDIKEKQISVYTRVGGGNRESYPEEIAALRANPNYIEDYDDDFDNTFATFLFKVPKKWEKDFDFIIKNQWNKVSKEYYIELVRVFPKLKNTFDKILK